ncbi:Mitochondrial substrate carrier family protein X [Porphyridium purpureum]|uniref:Mitochondrial substrate carrier family protein X n=1 Tax=Porphyridium purpureum TaxID=35688 RepID=A0A5J4YL41_PORPP|nr:Mitochondrial substrate carrier family protein X [Porphyridium purpureum]|eukprot:POR8959..scf249_10
MLPVSCCAEVCVWGIPDARKLGRLVPTCHPMQRLFVYSRKEEHAAAAAAPAPQLPLWRKLIYSGVSGAIATTCIYPLDFVKTQLQDQRGDTSAGGRAAPPPAGVKSTSNGTGTAPSHRIPHAQPPKYTGPLDCARKIVQADGLMGLYRGWPPNVILVMPEKALKITANDYFRSVLAPADGSTPSMGRQMLAGALAGFIQVFVTNPMELLKIQGATMKKKFAAGEISHMKSYSQLAGELGMMGLYTGVVSTWMRDVPFSLIYFPLYFEATQRIKAKAAALDRNMSVTATALIAGTVAGTFGAGLTTPLDVIKTRVHSQALASRAAAGGSQPSLGAFLVREVALIRTNFVEILRTEGPTAFFKGVVPRVLIISPLFGITMTAYENFVKVFG